MRFPDICREYFGSFKPAILVVLVALSVALEIGVHGLLGIETVYTHFFYIPIVIGAAWYGVRGISVALFLSALYIADKLILTSTIGPDPAMRAGMFVSVSLVIGLLSDSMRKRHGEVKGMGGEETPARGRARKGPEFIRRLAPPNVKRMHEEGDVPGLLRALGHSDPAVQYAAAEALGELREPSAVSKLMEVLAGDHYPGVRWKAAEALARIGEPAVIPLTGALHHPDEDVRWKAAIALGEIGDERAIPPLIELLGDSDRFVQSRAAYALGEFGARATPLLCLALASGNPSVRRGAVLALQKIRDPAALDDLLRAAGDPDGSVRAAALEALMQHGEEGYRQILSYLAALPMREKTKVFDAIREVSSRRLLLGFLPLLSEADRSSREFISSVIDAGARQGEGETGDGPEGL